MHGLANLFHATEGEGEIGKTSAHMGEREELLELLGRFQELNRVGVVLGNTSSDGENVLREEGKVGIIGFGG